MKALPAAAAAACTLALALTPIAADDLPAPEDMPKSYKAVTDYSIDNTDMCLALKRSNEKYSAQVARLIEENAALKARLARLENERRTGKGNVDMLPTDLKKLHGLPNPDLLRHGYFKIVNYWHNVRKTPSAKASVAGVLKKGDIVKVEKIVVKGGEYYWAKIRWKELGGKTGSVVSGWIYITNANDPAMRAVLEKMAQPY